MAEVATAAAIASPGWLRNREFDGVFIVGVAVIAVMSGLIVVADPNLFGPVLFADLWLLGYHHVIATYTRLCFDKQSFHEYRFELFVLPAIVFAFTFALAWGAGVWAVTTLYLYWQWFHYTRQSWGISQVYRAKSGGRVDDSPMFAKLCFYLVPAFGILYRSWQEPARFLFQEVWVIPVPDLLLAVVGVAALASLGAWVVTRVRAWREGRLPVAHTLYMLSHFTVFAVGYVLIEDITYGWLVINIWHNAQYILFVWLFNTNRFKGGVDDGAKLLSTLAQPKNIMLYFGFTLAVSTGIYYVLTWLTGTGALAGAPLFVLVFQAVNFHHYIVDSKIWKVRKKPMQQTLDLNKA